MPLQNKSKNFKKGCQCITLQGYERYTLTLGGNTEVTIMKWNTEIILLTYAFKALTADNCSS